MRLSNAPVSWGVFSAETAPLTAEAYLDQVAASGYAATELGPYGFLPIDPGALRDALAARKLALDGAVHVHDFTGPASELFAAIDRTGGLLSACGARHFVVMDGGAGYCPEGPTPGAWSAMTATLSEATARAEAAGLVLSVHPHVLTAVERLAQVERLLEETGVSICLDTGHHAFWGDDPVAFLRAAIDRIPYIHLKNVDDGLCAQVRNGTLGTRAALDAGAFCPLDAGAVEIPAVLAALRDLGFAGPVVVEQDWSPAATAAPVDLAARNAAFLKAAA